MGPPRSAAFTTMEKPTSIKITYFPIPGTAEPARLALVLGGIAFEDERVPFKQWQEELKPKIVELGNPYGQMPFMTVDGKVIAQSQAIGIFCAKLAGIHPADPYECAKVDALLQFIGQDIRDRKITPTMGIKDAEEQAAKRKKLAEEDLPPLLATLDSFVQPSGFLVGESATLADLSAYVLLNYIGTGTLDGVPPELITPGLRAFCAKINEIPAIKAWNEEKSGGKLPWF